MKLLTSIILCVSLVLSAQAKEPEPVFKPAAGYAVGVVVICVGGYCIYKMIKVCQKAFPPRNTNSNSGFMASSTDEYAGAYEYSSIGSCYVPTEARPGVLPAAQHPTTFTLNVMVQEAGVVTTMTVNDDEGTTQTWNQYQAEMAEHGLFLTGHATYQPQFSRGGVPCDGTLVPLEFDQATGRVINRTEGDLRRVVIERSPNLVDWSPLLQTDVGVGTGFKCIDTTREGACFYRVSASQP